MKAVFYSLLGYFLTSPGLVVLAVLDSSLIFFLPLGIDFVVIMLSARKPDAFWIHAVLATAGSLIGAMITFWIGRQIGEHGLTRLIKPNRLEHVKQQVGRHAGVSVGALAIIPPPFPFTAFVVASGAFGGHPWSFFSTLTAVRLIRFLAEAGLAAIYGRRILVWMQSRVFEWMVGALIVLAVAGTIVSAVAAYRSSRRTGVVGGV